MSKEHGVPFRFQCTEQDCKYGANSRDTFTDHLFSAHSINVGSKPILQCEYCEYFTIHKSYFVKHQLTHTAHEFSFKCTHDGCDKSFRQKRHLRGHIAMCHIDLKLSCHYCGSIFPTAIKLRRHEKRMHTDRVRNFKCGYCNHATVARENCSTHVKRSHHDKPVLVIDLRKAKLPPLPI